MRIAVPLLVLALTGGCAAQTPTARPAASPSPTTSLAAAPTTTPTASRSATPAAPQAWHVGASPLPLRPDGFGQVLPTPSVLRNRRLPTLDVLDPPRDGRFHAAVGAITAPVRARMGDTYRAGCPVRLDELRYVTVTFRGFDGKAHTGELVVAVTVASQVVAIFRELFGQGFPIEQMRLPTTADLTAPPTGDGNNSAGFVCRAARGQTRFSAHAYGLAIDVNPFLNPYRKRDLVLPELASAYTDRSWVRPGMFLPRSSAVASFTRRGWVWGGTYSSVKDWMHFSVTGD